MKTDLVFSILPSAASDIRALDRHISEREVDGTSAIDPKRRHLNEHLHGSPEGPSASLDALYKGGVKRPAAQAESPYLRVVISASPGYFRPHDPDARGTWDDDRMIAFRDRALAWLRAEFGDDLVYADLHLDEDTPHIHAVIAPTYGKRPRKPGRRKRNETEEQFEARKKDAENGKVIRTVGRASHPTLSRPGSFQQLRERLTASLSDIGIEYGDDRSPDAPDGISTREWVAQQAVQLRKQREAMAQQQRALMIRERVLDGVEDEIDSRESQLDDREAKLNERESRLRVVYQRVQSLLGAVADHLGVGRSLREISDTIRDYVLDDPEPETKNEDPFSFDPL